MLNRFLCSVPALNSAIVGANLFALMWFSSVLETSS
nr:MAG TPA: hypothetical protein [Caudoviricetes sp.]